MKSTENFSSITLTQIEDLFYPSGTRKFGGSTEESDYDFLVPPNECMKAWDILKGQETKREQYYSEEIYSYKFYTVDQPYPVNLIIFKDADNYNAWVFATDKMENMFEHYQSDTMLINRKERHLLFQTFVRIYLDRLK